ncbi:MAG: pyridoxal-phosphate dependent enzyme, partial [Minicystis sp.]
QALAPRCQVVGVEPEAGNDVQQSLAKGSIVHIAVPSTIADGAQTQHAGTLTFPVIQAHVSRIVTVSDAALREAMRFFFERMKLVVEPTGCLGAAAALSGAVDVAGKRVGVILSGGNIDPRRYAEALLAAG